MRTIQPTRMSTIAGAAAVLLLAGAAAAQTGVYTVNGITTAQADQTYAATGVDQSAVYVLNAGMLTLTNCTMTKAGDSANPGQSVEYGTNAGVLAMSGSGVLILGGSVTTNAAGADGLFATGSSSAIVMSNGSVEVSGAGAHGAATSHAGVVSISNVDVTTQGHDAAALAADFDGGGVCVDGGAILAACSTPGSNSPGIDSKGIVSVMNASVASNADCGGVIDGVHAISLYNTAMTGALDGIKIWRTSPATGVASVALDGGSLTAVAGNGFLVTGEGGSPASVEIVLTRGATVTTGTGNILRVIGSSTAVFTMQSVTLSGDLRADATSTLSVDLRDGSALTGMIVRAGLTLPPDCTWNVTGNSILTEFWDEGNISGQTVTNIVGNGHTVHYDANLLTNMYLDGQTYALVNGGILTPGPVAGIERRTWGSVKNEYR